MTCRGLGAVFTQIRKISKTGSQRLFNPALVSAADQTHFWAACFVYYVFVTGSAVLCSNSDTRGLKISRSIHTYAARRGIRSCLTGGDEHVGGGSVFQIHPIRLALHTADLLQSQ